MKEYSLGGGNESGLYNPKVAEKPGLRQEKSGGKRRNQKKDSFQF